MAKKRMSGFVTFRLKAETQQALQDIADEDDKDVSTILREMVERGIRVRLALKAKRREEQLRQLAAEYDLE